MHDWKITFSGCRLWHSTNKKNYCALNLHSRHFTASGFVEKLSCIYWASHPPEEVSFNFRWNVNFFVLWNDRNQRYVILSTDFGHESFWIHFTKCIKLSSRISRHMKQQIKWFESILGSILFIVLNYFGTETLKRRINFWAIFVQIHLLGYTFKEFEIVTTKKKTISEIIKEIQLEIKWYFFYFTPLNRK